MKRIASVLLALCTLVILVGITSADVTNKIVYQGKLKEYGVPANGTRYMQFDIYNNPNLSTGLLWSSNPVAVNVSSGVFSYTMQPTVDWRTTPPLYIQLTLAPVGSTTPNKPLTPREEITAQIYALHSLEAENIKTNSNVNFTIGSSTVATLTSDGYLMMNGQNVVPVGTIVSYAGDAAPNGWLMCDGTAVSRTTYANLFTVLQEKFGQGDGSTTFNLPDLRGRFLRGRDNGAGRDPDAGSRTAMNSGGNTGDSVGSIEAGAFASHAHSMYYNTQVGVPPPDNSGNMTINGLSNTVIYEGAISRSNQLLNKLNMDSVGGSETRPINASVNYIIKY